MSTATKANGMNKPKRKQGSRQFGLAEDAIVERIELPQPKRYSPPKCSACTALRSGDDNYTEVYRTARESGYTVRYCKCRFCGNTFKDLEKVG